MAVKLGIFDMTDLINLTLFCQQATVITDFSDLDRVGRDHLMNLNGGSMPASELDKADGRYAPFTDFRFLCRRSATTHPTASSTTTA